MAWTNVALLVVLAVVMAAGQVLLKIAAQMMTVPFGLAWVLKLALNPYFIAALALQGTAVALWMFLLTEVDLGRGYVIFALTLVLVVIAGVFVFKETVSVRQMLGIALILAGLLVVFTD